MEKSLTLVYPKNSESGALETLPKTNNLELISEDQFSKSYTNLDNSHKVCITSEATLDSVLKHLKDPKKKSAIQAMKDKLLFRDLLSNSFPSLQYKFINFEEISTLKVESKKVLKPIKGCFGTAVKILTPDSNLTIVANEIQVEINKNSSVLSDSVLSQTEFILEDYIEGEEYAVDMFYDSKGEPHIVNIYYHPIPKHQEYLHMIYYTSKSIFDKIYDKAILFFKTLNQKLELTNISLHSEFKYNDNLVPIEINAMRFGGMGLGNMIFHSLNINPYQYFIEEKSPDWKTIWDKNKEKNFVYLIAYNGTSIDKTKQEPDFNKLEHLFTKILNKTYFDYQKQLAFAVYTLEESLNTINDLLKIDFNDYFKSLEEPL